MGNVQMLLRQHVGAPCAPCVEVGAEVKKVLSLLHQQAWELTFFKRCMEK